MSFDTTKLQPVGTANSNAPRLWVYASGSDENATIDGSGFFNAAANKLQVGDLILAVSATYKLGAFVVNANSAGVVDCGNSQITGSAIDSD